MFNFGDGIHGSQLRPSGFLCDNGSPESPLFLKTSAAGFGTVTSNSAKQTGFRNQWTNGKKLLSWEYYDLYYNGRYIGLPIGGWILAAAITADNKIVTLTTDLSISFFGLNGTLIATDTTALASVTSIVGNNQQDPCRPCFNHDGSKLVFIGKNATTSAKPLPFATTLVNSTIPAEDNAYVDKSCNEYTTVGMPGIGVHSDAAVDVGAHQENWQCVYRVDVDTAGRTAAIASQTEQFAEHVYKVTHSYYMDLVCNQTDPYIYSFQNNGSCTSIVTALHGTPFVSYIWFDKDGTERVEMSDSSASLAITTTWAGLSKGETVGNDYVTTETEQIDTNMAYSLSTTANSVIANLGESVSLAGTSSFSKSSVATYESEGGALLSSSLSIVGDNTEVLTSNLLDAITGFNKYIANLVMVEAEYMGAPETLVAGPYSDTLSYTTPQSRTFAAAHFPFAASLTASPNLADPAGWIKARYHISDGGPNVQLLAVASGSSRSATYTFENFIFVVPKGLADADNYFCQALADRRGNMLYVLDFEGQTGVHAYRKDFVSESAAKQTEISAIVAPHTLKGVI